jgi:hypothetical protein
MIKDWYVKKGENTTNHTKEVDLFKQKQDIEILKKF